MKQAQGAIRQSPKGYADGGKVVSPWSFKGIANTVKGALTKTPEQEAQAVALAEYKARSAAERTQATPAPTQSAISSYAANTALDKRMQDAEQKKAGGAIRGKGTGTSDEVPIMASNGEFVIKTKAVKAIGLEVLEALNAIADKPDEKDSKAEAMREYGDGSESETHETSEDSIEGMKCGGKVKKMATGGLVDLDPAISGYGPNTTEGMAARQAAHQAQLDSANTLASNNAGKGALPVAPVAAPVAVDPMAAHNAALASAQALATARASGANPTVASEAAGRASYGNALESSKNAGSPSYFTQQTPTSQQNATTANQAASGALRSVYSTPAQVDQLAAPAPQGTPAASAQPAAPVQKPVGAVQSSQPAAPAPTATPTPGGDIPTPPVQAQPMLNGVAGKDVGFGATRIDAPGKSPLFTNVTNAADNASLQGRAPMTSQNQGAMDGLQARQDARGKLVESDSSAEQMSKDSSDLQQLAARAVLEKQGATPKEREAISKRTADAEQALLSSINTRKAQALQAGALRQSNQFNQQMARDKFGIELSQEARAAAKDALDAKQRDRLQSAFDAYDKDPSEKAAERVRVLMGKEKAAPPDSWGIRKVTDATGNVTEIPYNKHTGEDRGSQQAKAPPKTGDVVSGHKFKGGNPADQKNWEKV